MNIITSFVAKALTAKLIQKVAITIMFAVLDNLAAKSSNKLDDEIVAEVKKALGYES